MEKKCNIINYVNDNIDVSKFKNDVSYVIKLFEYTGDINLYNKCTNEMKVNYELVRYLVLKFQDNKIFVRMVATNYLTELAKINRNSGIFNDTNFCELVIIMSKVLASNSTIQEHYQGYANAIYFNMRNAINAFLSSDETNKVFEMGFVIVLMQYNSDVIRSYFATNYLHEIFYAEDKFIAKLLHKKFNNIEEIYNMGINNFIISYISSLDSELAGYVAKNLDLTTNIKNDIEEVLANWDNYNTEINKRRVSIVLEFVEKYISSNENINFNPYDTLYEILLAFHLEDTFSIPTDYKTSKIKTLDFNEAIFREKTINLIKKIFKERFFLERSNNIVANKNSNKRKIISFPYEEDN